MADKKPPKPAVSNDADKLGKLIRRHRKARGLTGESLAAALGKSSKSEVSAIETGSRVFSPAVVINYIRELRIDESDVPLCYLTLDALQRLDQKNATAGWEHPVTGTFASQQVRELMKEAGRLDCTAVDDGLLLLPSTPKLDLNRIPIRRSGAAPFLDLVNPKASELNEFPSDYFDPQIANFLKAAADQDEADEIQDTYQTKVAIKQFTLPALAFGANLQMTISPLSFWTLRKFNRAMGDGKHLHQINQMKRQAVLNLLRNDGSLSFRFPSALYVEATLTTADNKLVIVEKNPGLSVMAMSGRRWTASIEEGLSWQYYSESGEIDAVAAVLRGLDRELDLKPDQIEYIEFDALGLEYPTLNVGILGEVKTSLESAQLVSKIGASADYGRRYHFIDWKEVPEKVFFKPIASFGEWHSLARMRCILGLQRRHGFQAVFDMFS
ncbi:MAG: helix-turn-helix domain-containing protein [Cognatishimia sp.]